MCVRAKCSRTTGLLHNKTNHNREIQTRAAQHTSIRLFRASSQDPEEFRKKMSRMADPPSVRVSDEQVVKLNIILDDNALQFHEARQKMDPEMQAIASRQQNRIRAMLKPEQREE